MRNAGSIRACLAAVPIFRACSPKELDRLVAVSELVSVPAGRELVCEGSVGRELFVVVTGQGRVIRDGQTVATLGPGAYFGELSLIEGTVRNATVVAETPMDLVVLAQRELTRLLGEVPTLSRALLVGMSRRLQGGDGFESGPATAAAAV